MYESRLSLERTFEVLVSHRDEMSEVATEEKISSIRALEYKGASEDRAYLRHQSESPTSSLDRDGTGAKTRVGLVWS
jgi:hypothetical protein